MDTPPIKKGLSISAFQRFMKMEATNQEFGQRKDCISVTWLITFEVLYTQSVNFVTTICLFWDIYQHIFRNDIDGVTTYFLIFGPITIVRKDALSHHVLSTIPVRMLMSFQLGCGQVYHDEESWEDGFKYYDGYSLKIEEEECFREGVVVNFFERTDLKLMKTTVIFAIYIHDDEFDDKYDDKLIIALYKLQISLPIDLYACSKTTNGL